MGKIIGIISLVICVVSIVPSLVSGVGLVGAVLSIVIAGLAAAMKDIKYSTIASVITTVNIFGFSIFAISNNDFGEGALIFFGILYLVLVFGYLIGFLRIRHEQHT